MKFFSMIMKHIRQPDPIEAAIISLIDKNNQKMEDIFNLFSTSANGNLITADKNQLKQKLEDINLSIKEIETYISQNPKIKLGNNEAIFNNTAVFCSRLYDLIETMPNDNRLLPGLINLNVSSNNDTVTLGVFKSKPYQEQPETPSRQATEAFENMLEEAANTSVSDSKCTFRELEPGEFDPNKQVLDILKEDLLINEEKPGSRLSNT